MSEEYPEGDVFCAVCKKPLTTQKDKERGYHLHCEQSEVFCHDFLDEKKK